MRHDSRRMWIVGNLNLVTPDIVVEDYSMCAAIQSFVECVDSKNCYIYLYLRVIGVQ